MLKEPEIKLFGRKISLPEQDADVAGGKWSIENRNGGGGGCDRCFEEVGREEKQEQIDEELAEGEVCDTSTENEDDRNQSGDNPKNSPTEDDVESERGQKSDNEATKGLKKPDKIIPCPRCSSMDTKFCYFNNYNVNQPRHFCKSCQRYWTAGGTMRNVPVGAGRRKTKSSAPHCRHITISDPHRTLDFRPTATVLSFGKDVSPAAAPTPPPPASAVQNINGFPCIPGVPWPFPWSSAVPLPAVFPVPYYLWSNAPWAVNETAAAGAGSSPTSTLGKHHRSPATADGGGDGEGSKKKSSIVVPKTLRIDDPEEAARSSIWSTLGINYDSASREGLFKALQPKKQSTAEPAAASSLMQANPAAMSRSLKFQEAA